METGRSDSTGVRPRDEDGNITFIMVKKLELLNGESVRTWARKRAMESAS
jgi:hypothetical protein